MNEREEAKREAKRIEQIILDHDYLIEDPFFRGILAALYTIALCVTYLQAIKLIRVWSACLVRHISTETG